jgi:hypothetical protein
MTDLPPPIVTRELSIVDATGVPRIVLSAGTDQPVIRMLRPDGKAALTLTLDPAGRPSVTLENPQEAGPKAAVEVDDKGAHVKFDRPGGASSYVFLNNSGGSGLVLIDPKGVRRLSATVAADGSATIERLGADGKPQP